MAWFFTRLRLGSGKSSIGSTVAPRERIERDTSHPGWPGTIAVARGPGKGRRRFSCYRNTDEVRAGVLARRGFRSGGAAVDRHRPYGVGPLGGGGQRLARGAQGDARDQVGVLRADLGPRPGHVPPHAPGARRTRSGARRGSWRRTEAQAQRSWRRGRGGRRSDAGGAGRGTRRGTRNVPAPPARTSRRPPGRRPRRRSACARPRRSWRPRRPALRPLPGRSVRVARPDRAPVSVPGRDGRRNRPGSWLWRLPSCVRGRRPGRSRRSARLSRPGGPGS